MASKQQPTAIDVYKGKTINQIAQVSSMIQAMIAATERIFEFLEIGDGIAISRPQ